MCQVRKIIGHLHKDNPGNW